MKKQTMTYMDSVHRWGTVWNLSVMVILLACMAVMRYFVNKRTVGGV